MKKKGYRVNQNLQNFRYTADHSTIMRWVHQYSPEIEKKIRRHLRPTNGSWKVDETYIKIKGK